MDGHTSLEPSGFPLKAFPAEILNSITFHLDWSSIMDLWCCGDVTLHRVMKHRGVTRFEVTITEKTRDYIFPFGWRFFAGLSDLSLHLDHLKSSYMVHIREGLQSVTSALRKLSLKFPEAEWVLFAPKSQWESSFGDLQIENAGISSKSPCRFWFGPNKLPNLEFLELDSYLTQGRLCNGDIGHLPHSLTELRICTSNNNLDSDVMLHLGPQVETLWISFKSQANPVLSLPPHLQSLIILKKLEGSVIGLVPSNLTSFHAHNWPINIENLPCLPPCTQSIILKLLPGEETRVKLPIGLTSLTLPSHGPNVFQNENFFPSDLVSLTCNSSLNLTQSHWPIHLTSLKIQDMIIPGKLEAFPDTLTHLELRFPIGADITQRKYEALMEAMPPSILELSLIIGDKNMYFTFPSSKFQSLLRLTLHGPFEFSQNLVQGLSRRMEQFNLRCKGTWNYEKCFSLLPPYLRDLELEFFCISQPTCLKYLPRDLTQLNLFIRGIAKENDFRQLPRSLTILILPYLDNVEENAWHELPSGLTTLSLGVAFTKIDFSVFPPKLRQFTASRASVVLSRAQMSSTIPRNIKVAQIGAITFQRH